MDGFAQTTTPGAEIVAASSSGLAVVSARSASPGWETVWSFELSRSVTGRLFATQLSVSAPDLTVRVRLWDIEAGEVVAGGIVHTSETPENHLGARVSLSGGKTYQVQVECTGASGDDKFAVIEDSGVTA